MQEIILPTSVTPSVDSLEMPNGTNADGDADTLGFSKVFMKLLEGFQALQQNQQEVVSDSEDVVVEVEETPVDGEEVSAEEVDVDIDVDLPEVDQAIIGMPLKEVPRQAEKVAVLKVATTAKIVEAAVVDAKPDATSAKPQPEKAEVAAQLAKAPEKETLRPVDPLPARIALAKLTELAAAFGATGKSESKADEQQPKDLVPGRKVSELATTLTGKPGFGESLPISGELVSEAVKNAGMKAETPLLTPATIVVPASIESSGSRETQATLQLSPQSEAPTIRTVGDFTIRSVKHLLGSQEESIQIRLVPRSLGELHIAVKTIGDSIEIVVSAANALVRDVLESQLSGLKDVLSRDGVDVSKVTVHNGSMSDMGSSLAQSQAHRQQGSAANLSGEMLSENEDEFGESDGADKHARSRSHDGDLDMLA
ncbi:MAG: flagellar hook-length control protein FliK [Candidatus Hydrogenedentota bacterium]